MEIRQDPIGDNMRTIPLKNAGNANAIRTRSKLYELTWTIVEFLIITNPLQISSRLRIRVLKFFGANVGSGAIIRPRVRIKYPWKLSIGNDCWIGEGVWIHNQDFVTIESDVVLSQESFITTGSHNTSIDMSLETSPVIVKQGAWITSRSMILKGVIIGRNAIITPNSVCHKSIPDNAVYGGNPIKFIKNRIIDESMEKNV